MVRKTGGSVPSAGSLGALLAYVLLRLAPEPSWLLPQDRFDQGAYRRSAYGAAREHVTVQFHSPWVLRAEAVSLDTSRSVGGVPAFSWFR